MVKTIGILVVFVALTTIASARIGETEDEISTRYGQSVGDISTEAFGKVRGFMSVNYLVAVKLVDGRSQMEMFSKNDQSDLSAGEIEKLLRENGAGEWKAELITGKPGWRRWRREDGALVALYDAGRHFLYINSKQFYEDQGKKIEASEPRQGAAASKPPK
jgi:hypothetical protein